MIATISIPHLRQLHFQTSGGYSSSDCCVPSHTFVHLNSGNLNSGSLNSDNNYIVPFLTTMFDVLLFRNLSVPHPCMNELLFFLKLQKLNQRRTGPCLAVCLIPVQQILAKLYYLNLNRCTHKIARFHITLSIT